MTQHPSEFDERELAKLEREIAQLGTPYSSPEPDPAYWANFRVRVMQQVTPKRPPFHLFGWIAEHLLGTSLIGVGLAAAVLVSVFGLPTSSTTAPPIASVQVPASVGSPSVESQRQAAVTATEPPKSIAMAGGDAGISTKAADHESIAANRVADAVDRKSTRPHVATVNSAESTPPDDLLASASTTVLESAARPVLVSSESDYPVSLSELSTDDLEAVYEGLASLDSSDF